MFDWSSVRDETCIASHASAPATDLPFQCVSVPLSVEQSPWSLHAPRTFYVISLVAKDVLEHLSDVVQPLPNSWVRIVKWRFISFDVTSGPIVGFHDAIYTMDRVNVLLGASHCPMIHLPKWDSVTEEVEVAGSVSGETGGCLSQMVIVRQPYATPSQWVG